MDRIPEKFQKVGRSFVERISGDLNKGSLSSFCAFPRDVSFTGKDPSECVVLLVRKSFAAFIPQYILIIALLLAPLLLFAIINSLDISGGSAVALGFGGAIIFLLLAFTVAVDTFLKWFYSVNIITDQRVIDVDFGSVLYHRFSETQLENIEDATHEVAGLVGSIFDFGSVYIQTAGTKNEFEFDLVPRPNTVQDVLLDVLEMKQKGEI